MIREKISYRFEFNNGDFYNGKKMSSKLNLIIDLNQYSNQVLTFQLTKFPSLNFTGMGD